MGDPEARSERLVAARLFILGPLFQAAEIGWQRVWVRQDGLDEGPPQPLHARQGRQDTDLPR
jgi:hypothetical protein